MRKNVFIKSMRRQGVRNLLLLLIIGLAAFAGMSRIAEYVLVRNQLEDVIGTYDTVGFLQHSSPMGDISAGLDIIANNPYIEFEDKRRVAEGVMQDVLSADIAGMWAGIPFENHARHTLAYFYGVPLGIYESYNNLSSPYLIFTDVEVLAGFPEYVKAGQRVYLVLAENVSFDDFEWGQRYLIKGYYHTRTGALGSILLPNTDNDRDNILHMLPLNDDGLMFLEIPQNESADFSQPELAHIPYEIEWLRNNNSAVLLQTTVDMSLMSTTVSKSMPLVIDKPYGDGRLLNRDDHISANPVVVIDSYLARMRGLSVGDTLTIIFILINTSRAFCSITPK
jgi:hypothetical protein